MMANRFDVTGIDLPTLDDIQAWLQSRPEHAVVGECRHSTRCLIAEYMNATYSQFRFDVGPVRAAGEVGAIYLERPSTARPGRWIVVEHTSLTPELNDLANRFDQLVDVGGVERVILRDQALELFEVTA